MTGGAFGGVSFRVVGDGPPVVVLHGLGGDHRQALDLLPPDLRATRIAPDLPGHGDTDLDDRPVGFAPFADLTAALLGDLAISGPVPVVGVSMGAGVAVALATARPDLVDRLILVRPAWLDRPPTHLAVFRVVADLLGTLGPGAGAEAFTRTEEFAAVRAVSPTMAASLLGQFDRPHAVARRRVLATLPVDAPATAAAHAQLGVPTTVVAAPGDPVHPEALARTLAGWIPGAELVLVPAKGPDPAGQLDHLAAVRVAVARGLR
ncbi:alpha/beta fold hydrolase [Nakamurella flavida]|uniref:Alpha/beta fold hydrolase n=1 Tax=Nakamurella flavida TaxID=363630 RepID=A0A938YN53_9ACTN|nr:alpha/beta hydrolase [Nakamurella flavida]MBM9477611.1 alpha/beta fold hydrolase [Nakamurella flavida]MDP9779159.1 pimeloyl-ACP methyl ester carboxylesterase [Nakamurella flavida]